MRNAALTSPPKKPIVRPAIAGPTIRAPLKIAELRATALATSSRPTISTVNAWRVGMSTALVMPRIVASTRICHTWTVSVTTSANRMNASVIWTAWVTISVWRLGSASAIRPPNSPSRSTGRNASAVVRPRTSGSLVSSRTSHAWATCCIQVPTRLTSWPPKNSR